MTFVGSGKPTLQDGLGWMIRQVKAVTDIPVAVITNGSLLCLPEVREEVSAADAALPTLDAGADFFCHTVNRPRRAFTFGRLVDGLAKLPWTYAGKL